MNNENVVLCFEKSVNVNVIQNFKKQIQNTQAAKYWKIFCNGCKIRSKSFYFFAEVYDTILLFDFTYLQLVKCDVTVVIIIILDNSSLLSTLVMLNKLANNGFWLVFNIKRLYL